MQVSKLTEKLNKRNILNTNFSLLEIKERFRVGDTAPVSRIYLVISERELCSFFWFSIRREFMLCQPLCKSRVVSQLALSPLLDVR